jgi:hypothetical protein
MSLRVFHIVFVIVTIVLSLFVTLWGIRAFSIVLMVYGKKVARKLKELP